MPEIEDVYGQALHDYYYRRNHKLLLYNNYGPKEEMPIALFFRDMEKMPTIETKAMSLCKGKVLDIGAGVGSHALILQKQGIDVTIERSALAVEIMKKRGVRKAIAGDIFALADMKFDTLLLLMNGIGLVGNLDGLKYFLQHAKTLLLPGGQLLFDSCDILYLYQGGPTPTDRYYGEISFRYEYKNKIGEWFKWLYVDQQTLETVATKTGWHCQVIYEDDKDQYLVRLTLE